MVFANLILMLRKIFALLLFVIPNLIFGQNSIDSTKDTTISYIPEKKYYVLDLVGAHQTIYFDSVVYHNDQPIIILIRNNTNDTIWFMNFKGLGTNVRLFFEKSSGYLKPFECYSLSLHLYAGHYRPYLMLPIKDNVNLYYLTNFQEKQFSFAIKGHVSVDTLPGFAVESLPPTVLISTSQPPQSFIDHVYGKRIEQKTENVQSVEQTKTPKIPEFKFRKELWIYPFTSDSILPTNITLKYFINDSSHYAKKRLDSLNHVYFKIPMELGDSVYCVLSSPEYGFIAKKTLVREQVNEITISFKPPVSLYEPHYYDISGNRVLVNKNLIGHYFIPRGIADTKLIMQNALKHIDSLNILIENFGAEITYGLDGYILKCKPELALQIKKKFGNFEIYQQISENIWVTDTYGITFASKISREKIAAIFVNYGITEFIVNPTPDYGNNTERNLISHVQITLKNLPGSMINNQTINDLLRQREVLRVTQERIDFPVLDD